MVGELPLERLRHAVPPFPTRSEIWRLLLEQAGVYSVPPPPRRGVDST